MNESKNQWKLLKNANGIMFFGHINIVGTNPFQKGLCLVLSKGQTKTHKEVQKIVGWSQPCLYKRQQIKPYGFLHSDPKGLNVQIQRGKNGIIGIPPKQIPIWYYEKILLMLLIFLYKKMLLHFCYKKILIMFLIFHHWKMLPNFHYKKIPLNFHYKKLASIFHYK